MRWLHLLLPLLEFGGLYTTATIFPSSECLNERRSVDDIPTHGVMILIRPPVWRSQLMTFWPIRSVKRRLSGEKPSCCSGRMYCRPGEIYEVSKTRSRPRVTASRSSRDLGLATAMNLLQG